MRGVVRTVLLALLVAVAGVAVAQGKSWTYVNGIKWEIEALEGGKASICVPQEGRKKIQGRVEIPDKIVGLSVVEIGKEAFDGCSGLTEIVIPSGVTRIGERAFDGCSGLTEVAIPDGVTEIESSAFWNCSGLKKVSIPSSVTKIGVNAFSDCSGLAEVAIPDGVTEIERFAFYNCSGLKKVSIPSSVTKIGRGAFCKCAALNGVTIPNSVTEIGEMAFEKCVGLTTLTIPGSVTKIGSDAFYGCSSLTAFEVDGGDTYCAEGGVIFTKDKRTLVRYPSGKAGAYTIPNGVTAIEKYAFWGCDKLDGVGIPGSVTTIGDSAFMSCSGLTVVPNSSGVTTIGRYAFAGCDGMTAVAIPEGVKEIGDYAFSGCSGVKEVRISSSVKEINSSVFAHCGALQAFKVTGGDSYCEVEGVLFTKDKTKLVCYPVGRNGAYTIPDGVTEIWDGAFEGCSGLTAVSFPAGSLKDINLNAFKDCSGLTAVSIPDGVELIDVRAFENCEGLETVSFAGSVDTIEFEAFIGCSSLTEVTIPEGVKKISDGVFYGCENLTEVNIPRSVRNICYNAFCECSSLTQVTIPSGVDTIDESAFESCDHLNAVYWLAGAKKEIHEKAFEMVPRFVTLYVRPGEKEDIEKEEWAQGFEDIVEGHVVSFQDDGGNLLGEQLVEPNGKATGLKPVPTKEGFTFVEWQLKGARYDFDTPVTKDITLVAKWEALPQFKVTFNADGGTPAPEAQMVTKGGTAKAPTAPTKEGFTFVEWQLEGSKYDFNAPVTKDITLVAKWAVLPQFKVTFNAEGGTPAPEAQTVTSGKTAMAPTAPIKEGFTFVEWQLEGSKYDFNAPVTKAITLVAKWEKLLKFKVTFNADGGTPAPEEQLVAKGETAKAPTAPTKAGFTFVEWQLEGVKYDFSTPVTKDITLVAKWEALLKFKVTFNADGGTPTPEEQLVAKGETAKVPTAPTKAGFTFVEWQLEGVKYNFDTPVTKDITLVAKWEKIEEKGPNSHSTAVESALLSGVHAVSNPVGDALVLEGMASAARVEVYGLRGVQVQAEALHGAGRVVIDARGWTSGVYVVRVVASDGEKTLRVVK